MNIKNINKRPLVLAAVMAATLGLSACSSIGYRCPLDPTEKPESATACAGMNEAMAGAKADKGGRTSVLLDDRGRIVPREVIMGKAAVPLKEAIGQVREPYNENSGSPNFIPPKQFQVWASSFVDANGALHDGHTAWVSTPGRWAYGTVDGSSATGDALLRPATPQDVPARIVEKSSNGSTSATVTVKKSDQNKQERDKAALQALSNAANSAAQGTAEKPAANPVVKEAQQQMKDSTTAVVNPQAATGVTAPAISLSN